MIEPGMFTKWCPLPDRVHELDPATIEGLGTLFWPTSMERGDSQEPVEIGSYAVPLYRIDYPTRDGNWYRVVYGWCYQTNELFWCDETYSSFRAYTP